MVWLHIEAGWVGYQQRGLWHIADRGTNVDHTLLSFARMSTAAASIEPDRTLTDTATPSGVMLTLHYWLVANSCPQRSSQGLIISLRFYWVSQSSQCEVRRIAGLALSPIIKVNALATTSLANCTSIRYR